MERLPGFRDFYPEPVPHSEGWSADARQYIFEAWRQTARRYGFREYDGPPIEAVEMYTTKSGDEIVGQLYNFVDKGERAVALRPEMTPTLARMVSAHERNYKKPMKWFAIPQLFRYERQQKGRLREHFQFNADIVGEADPAADAEIIALLIDSLRVLQLSSEDFVIRLSSRQAWQEFLAARACPAEATFDFYQTVDKMDREEESVSGSRLAKLGFKLDDVQAFIAASRPTPELSSVLQNLAARGLGDFVKVDYKVIRGLAYYTGVVFEAFDQKGEFRAIAGGGRYDHLIKLMSRGKVDLPALGFGMGDVVLLELLKTRGLLPKFGADLQVFFLIEDETLRAESLRIIEELRCAGSSVDYCLTPLKPDKQFKRALELNALQTCRLQRDEAGMLVCGLKNLANREEKTVSPAQLLAALAPVTRGLHD